MLPGCLAPDWPAPAGVVAFTTTRQGGVSQMPFDSFNLAAHVGDSADAVMRNRRLLADHLLPQGTGLQWLRQVHGTGVVEVTRAGAEPVTADACWSRSSGVGCAVLTADCLPLLITSRCGGRVAAVHAGWRGLLQGVIEAALDAMGVAPRDLMAWLGPGIGPGAFEVGPEVRDAFLQRAPPGLDEATGACFAPGKASSGRYFADLCELARIRLRGRGVDALYGGTFCTVSDAGRYFSYRRDGRTGRMASVILPVGAV